MFIELPRTVIKMTGDDRVSFLQNFCTADIKQMKTGEICEAFILGTKGKLVGHVLVHCHSDWLELDTVPNQAAGLITHLDRYLIREDVELNEQVQSSFFCFGDISELTNKFAVPQNRFTVIDEIKVANCEAAGQGILVFASEKKQLELFLEGKGELPASTEQLEMHRVQFGTPWFQVDSDTNTLPQELQRDEQAISFTKGCYLGQETVARIDALGRVNKLLVRLKSSTEFAAGQALMLGEKEVGRVSSVASDEADFLGLAIVRREAATAGTMLNGDQNIEVI